MSNLQLLENPALSTSTAPGDGNDEIPRRPVEHFTSAEPTAEAMSTGAPSTEGEARAGGPETVSTIGAASVEGPLSLISTPPARETQYAVHGSAPPTPIRTTKPIAAEDDLDEDRPSALGQATSALRRIVYAEGPDDVAFLDASRALRRAMVTEEFRAPRHAALALIVSDALAFTSDETLDDWSRARRPLLTAFRELLKPFVPVEQERVVLRGLLDAGWHLTPPFDSEMFAEIEPELGA